MVEDLALFLFLQRLDGQTHLFAELVKAVAVKVRDARVRVQDRLDRAQMILPRVLLIIDKGVRQFRLAFIHRQQFHCWSRYFRNHTVHTIDAAIDIDVRQQLQQPAWRNFVPLRSGDGGGGQIARGLGVEGREGIRIAHEK